MKKVLPAVMSGRIKSLCRADKIKGALFLLSTLRVFWLYFLELVEENDNTAYFGMGKIILQA